MNCEIFMHSIDAYIDSELDLETRIEFENHMHECNSCKIFYESYSEMMSGLHSISKTEVIFPNDLHSNIMNNVNSFLKENDSNIIDLNEAINKNNNDKNNNDKRKKQKSSFSLGNHKSTLVAGFLSILVATGAYQTIKVLKSPIVESTPMISVPNTKEINEDLPNTEIASQDSTENLGDSENTEVAAFSETNNEEITNNKIDESTTVGDSANTVDEATPTEQSKTPEPDTSVSSVTTANEPIENQDAPISRAMTPEPYTSVSNTGNYNITISLDTDAILEDYLDYVINCPDINVNAIDKSGENYIVTASTTNIDNFISYANSFSKNNNNFINISYLDEDLDKINTLSEFQFVLTKQ